MKENYVLWCTNEPLKIQQPILENSSENDERQCETGTQHSPVNETKFFYIPPPSPPLKLFGRN